MKSVQLDLVAARLEGLEETIISKLIDRAQFRRNRPAYATGESGFDGATTESLFELRLRYQEEIDAVFGRFTVPEERPFYRDLPASKRRVTVPDNPLKIADYNTVNLTRDITISYLALLDRLCAGGDDRQYGSSVEHDVFALQAISRRIHFGSFFVAESKFQSDPDGYLALVSRSDAAGLEKRLTRPEVEERILRRIHEKVDHIQSRVNPRVRILVDPQLVVDFYRSVVIPITKRGEVLYLFARQK